MPRGRTIYYSAACDEAAEKLGGYARIDESLDAVWDVIRNNPYKLPICQSDWFNARYIVTKPTGICPALVWLITIQPGGDVVIEHVEVAEDYQEPTSPRPVTGQLAFVVSARRARARNLPT